MEFGSQSSLHAATGWDVTQDFNMAVNDNSLLPTPTPEHRRVAAGQFEHANQVIATRKNYDYGIVLLLKCCLLDPGNLIYRQALRRTQRARFQNKSRASMSSWKWVVHDRPARWWTRPPRQG